MTTRTRHIILLILAALLPATRATAQQSELDNTVRQVIRESGMHHAVLSVCVYDVDKGEPLYSYNAHQSVIPASTQKLFTVGAAMAKLGTDFRFSTRLGLTGHIDRDGVLHGNIYIVGGGDPLLGSYRYRQTSYDSLFNSWCVALRKKGIRRVDGRVCYNTSVFDNQPLHDTWQWGDIGNYYASGVYGLNFHENMFFVYFNGSTRIGQPATATRVEPKNISVRGFCEVTTGPEGSGDQVTIYGSPTNDERTYRGTVPLGARDFRVRGAMPTPPRTCADIFSSYLRAHGISVSSTSTEATSLPDSMRVVLDYQSANLYTIAQYTNLTSNNLYAESLFKYMGHKKYNQGTFASGARVVSDFFRERKLESSGTRVVDGSGLSRLNRTTADFLCRFLVQVAHEPFYDEYCHTLAVAGQSGTAKNLLPSLPANITVRLKTGTMDEVKSYAGYVVTPSGQTLAFAIVSNGHECSSAAIGDKLAKILLRIATAY